MGFDFGLKRIGVAVGSPLTECAQPVVTLQARQGVPDWKQLDALVKDWQPTDMVVGHPQSATDKNLMRKLRVFVRELEHRFGRPVYMIDEAYSSLEARRHCKQNPRSVQNARQAIDKIAAALILESWFYENSSSRSLEGLGHELKS